MSALNRTLHKISNSFCLILSDISFSSNFFVLFSSLNLELILEYKKSKEIGLFIALNARKMQELQIISMSNLDKSVYEISLFKIYLL